jgi:hypothetical protein
MGARGVQPEYTERVEARLTRAQMAQAYQAAATAGLGLGPFIRAVLADYMRDPHPLEREEIHT